MQNIDELRTSLADNYDKLLSGKLKLGVAKELANTAGKIIGTLKVESSHRMFVGNKQPIPFLNVDYKEQGDGKQ
ncbi:MAG: hypothetical protein Q8861_02170 [Bacteroidota bacterium]|nr:hypothetical protein [Bacteroidota bacterium]